MKDLIKLVMALVAVSLVAAGAYLWTQSGGDQTKKYSHPISRQGANW